MRRCLQANNPLANNPPTNNPPTNNPYWPGLLAGGYWLEEYYPRTECRGRSGVIIYPNKLCNISTRRSATKANEESIFIISRSGNRSVVVEIAWKCNFRRCRPIYMAAKTDISHVSSIAWKSYNPRSKVPLRPSFLPGPGLGALLSSYLEGALCKFYR